MGHHELIDLVKKLLVERASKPTSLTNPSKDATAAGHVSLNQESLVQSSQAILQGLAEGGYIHAKTPKFESFFGDDKQNKLDFDMWERQVLSAATTHSGTAVKQAMMQSLKGQALMVISALPPETSWDKLLQALKIKYQDKASYDVLMAQFYGTKIEPDEKCASFGTRLEQKLNQVSLQYPNKISESMYWNCVRERFFHGLSKDMRTNLRTQFDSGANYYRLLELARIVESESLHEDSKTEMKSTTTKGKGKVSVATVDSTSQQIQQLQGAVKGLTKMLQGNQQITQTPQYVSQPAQNTIQELVQNDMNTLPQAKTLLVLLILRELEVAEVAIEVEEVQYYVIGVETSYLRSKLVIKWLNVPIKNKPKIAGGKISLVMFKGKQLLHNLRIRKTDKGNYS